MSKNTSKMVCSTPRKGISKVDFKVPRGPSRSNTDTKSAEGTRIPQAPKPVKEAVSKLSAKTCKNIKNVKPKTAVDGSKSTVGAAPSASASSTGGGGKERIEMNVDFGSLESQPYYHGLLPRGEVEAMLKKDGDFLVRKSEVNKGENVTMETLVISVMYKKMAKHVLINHKVTGWTVETLMFDNVVDLIKWYKVKELPLTSKEPIIIKKAIERQPWQLQHQQIELKLKLGEGAFGEVWKADFLVEPGRIISAAVKTQKNTNVLTKEMIKTFVDEAKLMRSYSHPNIVHLLGIASQKQPIMIVMEFCEGGTLLGYLRKKGEEITTAELTRLCMEASSGLAYLEKNGCVHRDIAARNCLLTGDRQVKISDFGLSVNTKEVQEVAQNKALPVKWLAPETVTKKIFSSKSDVWAFGIMMWEVFALGREPYDTFTSNIDLLRAVVRENYRLPKPSGATPTKIFDLMQNCWDSDPDRRPTFKSLEKSLKSLVTHLSKV